MMFVIFNDYKIFIVERCKKKKKNIVDILMKIGKKCIFKFIVFF